MNKCSRCGSICGKMIMMGTRAGVAVSTTHYKCRCGHWWDVIEPEEEIKLLDAGGNTLEKSN